MNYKQKQEVVAQANKRRGAVSDEKGPGYTGAAGTYRDDDSNVLANFYHRADRGRKSVFSVVQDYAGKHVDAIETALSELSWWADTSWERRFSLVTSGEGLISRLDDLRNYCDLIECLLVDETLHPEYLTESWKFVVETPPEQLQLFNPTCPYGFRCCGDPNDCIGNC